MSSLIGPDQQFALWAILLALTALALWSERFAWVRKYSSVMLLIAVSIALSNLRIIPFSAPTYDAIWDYLVPLAIPLLLFDANLARIVRESGTLLVAFLVGALGVACGAIVATTLLDIGAKEAELAGIFTGTYIGGGLNFFAVADATGMQGDGMLAAAWAADNVATNLHFLLILLLPGMGWLVRRFPGGLNRGPVVQQSDTRSTLHIEQLDVAGLLFALALAFALAATGEWLAAVGGKPEYSILVITALSLAIASAAPGVVAHLSGYREAGTVLIYLFLASSSAAADVWELVRVAPVLFVFASIIISVHLLILLGAGRALRLDLAEVTMASAICVGGPSSALALSSNATWRHLLIPGVLAGSFGYAIGSFIGVAVTEWLR